MSEYIFILLWLAGMSFVAELMKVERPEYVNGRIEYKYGRWFALLVIIPLVWMTANRTMHFGDTYTYKNNFEKMPLSFSEISTYITTKSKDQGFYYFSAVIKTFIGNNYILYFGILGALQGLCVILIFRKYSINMLMSMFLFIASSDYLSWMYNGIRQFSAVTIILAATTFIVKRKYIALIIVILIASTFHKSALIMIPLILIAQGKAWNKRTLIFIVLAILAVVFVDKFTNLMDNALSETQYTNVVSDYKSFNDDGTNPIRVLVYSIPAILSFFFRRRINIENDPLINFSTNASIISMCLYLISMVTSGIFIGRLPIYVSLYSYILLPWIIAKCFSIQSSRFINECMVFFYLMFYYFQIHYTWHLI